MNNPNVLTEAAVLTQVNKWVGVIIALIGALVAAPDGARLIFRASSTWLRAQANRFRKPSTQTIQIGAAGEGNSVGSMTVIKSGYAWTPDAPVDERIETLRAYIAGVETRLNEALSALSQERADREAAVTELARILHARLDELHQLLKEKDRQMATIDARGLPVIGFGIVLNGIPEALAEIPWHLGWILPFLGFGLMVAVVTGAARARQAAGTGTAPKG